MIQCPPSFEPIDEHVGNLEALLDEIDRDAAPRLAWEPRDAWAPDQVRDVCRRLDLVHATDPFAMESQTPDTLYYRLHGRPADERNYGYAYTDADLDELAAACEGADEAWVLFNNHSMFEDARRFRGKVEGRGLEVV